MENPPTRDSKEERSRDGLRGPSLVGCFYCISCGSGRGQKHSLNTWSSASFRVRVERTVAEGQRTNSRHHGWRAPPEAIFFPAGPLATIQT